MASPSRTLYESLTRRHGVKVECRASVEECCLAAGNTVGHSNIVSASRMNNAVVLFLKTVEKANDLVQSGVVIHGQLTPALPLSSPSKKIILSNVPPFVKDELIARELSRFGKLVSPIRKIPLGCKSPLIKHLVSFRRIVYMVLKDGDDLDLTLTFRIDEFDYTVYVSSDAAMKCFWCGETGHLVRACPNKTHRDPDDPASAGRDRPGSSAAGLAVVVPPAAAARPAAEDPSAAAVPEGEEPSGSEFAAGDSAGPERAAEGSAPAVEGSAPAVEGSAPAVEGSASAVEGSAPAVGGSAPAEVGGSSGAASAGVVALEAEAEAEVDMVVDEPVFKAPGKRKKRGSGKMHKQAKKEVSGVDVDSESDGSLSDSGWSVCSQELPVVYSAEEIRRFLSVTKGQKGVRVEEHFTDCQQFINDVKYFRREGVFVDTELFRLKKILTRLHKASNDGV